MINELKKGAFLGLIMIKIQVMMVFLCHSLVMKSLTAAGPAVLARMQDVPIIFVTIHYSPYSGKHELEAHPPIYVERTDDKKRDIAVTTTLLNEFYRRLYQTLS